MASSKKREREDASTAISAAETLRRLEPDQWEDFLQTVGCNECEGCILVSTESNRTDRAGVRQAAAEMLTHVFREARGGVVSTPEAYQLAEELGKLHGYGPKKGTWIVTSCTYDSEPNNPPSLATHIHESDAPHSPLLYRLIVVLPDLYTLFTCAFVWHRD